MTRRIGTLLLAALVFVPTFPGSAARAAEEERAEKRDVKSDVKADSKADAKADAKAEEKAAAVVDKAIEALGGAAKLSPIKAATWQTKGKIILNGGDNAFTSRIAICGLRQFRQEFEGTFNNEEVKGATVLNGDQGWRRFNGETHELDKDAIASERRTTYLQAAAADPLVLKAEGFKIESAAEEKVGDKPASVVKVTGPDGKGFTMYFDKESGLPVRQVAKVSGWDGEEFTQDLTFSAYKDFAGVKKATRVEAKRDGEKFIEYDVTDFKALSEEMPAEHFGEPK